MNRFETFYNINYKNFSKHQKNQVQINGKSELKTYGIDS